MSRPTYDALVDEQYLIEALTSSGNIVSYLDNFPEEVFNTSPDSRLYKFLYTLIGPAGVSFLKLNYFYARLQLEEHGFNFDQLDKLYGNPFRFARNFDESYLESSKNVLDADSWALIKSLDEAYRQRAIDYFHAARLGPTVEGMRLAAKSALGYNTRIIENYQHIFNQHTDQILNYNFNINANRNGYYNTEEFTVIPNDPAPSELKSDSTAEVLNVFANAENLKEVDAQTMRLLRDAVENLKPMNTVLNTSLGQADSYPIDIKSASASSEFYQVTKFVTGNSNINWPTQSGNDFNSVYWVEADVEKEAPRNHNDFQQHYQGFYKPNSVTASSYAVGSLNNNSALITKFSALKNLSNSGIWSANQALADYPEPISVTRQNANTNTSFVNHEYPIDYLSLNNVPTVTYQRDKFWMSELKTSGEDYLIIDLGSTQSVNFLIFEILNAPIDIEISYADDIQDTSLPNLSSITCGSEAGSTTYTYTFVSAHNLQTGDSVTITEVSGATCYNGTFTIKSTPTTSSFTVQGNIANPSQTANIIKAKVVKNVWTYQPVVFDPLYPNHTLLDYQGTSLNKWGISAFTFDMVFGRFVKIKFTRNTDVYLNQEKFLVDTSKNPAEASPWPIVVKNLRVGRNIV